MVGSFIIGIDTDKPGIGDSIARAAKDFGIDAANVLILTPLPGTELYAQLEREGRIRSVNYPQDWKYYTLTYPVADYKNLTWVELLDEVNRFNGGFTRTRRSFAGCCGLPGTRAVPGRFASCWLPTSATGRTTFWTSAPMPAGSSLPIWKMPTRPNWANAAMSLPETPFTLPRQLDRTT